MSCMVSCICIGNNNSRVLRRGTEPKKPSTWEASAWFVLPTGEKHTHTAKVPGQTVHSLVPYMGALIDSLIADHGNEVRSAGWTASSHGRKR